MSKMGRAFQWVCENGLENNPHALQMYLAYIKEHASITKENESVDQNDIEDSE